MIPKKNPIIRFFHKHYEHARAIRSVRNGRSRKAWAFFACYGATKEDVQAILNIYANSESRDHFRGHFVEKLLEFEQFDLTKADFLRFIKRDEEIAKALLKQLNLRGQLVISDFILALEYRRYELAARMAYSYTLNPLEMAEALEAVPMAEKNSKEFESVAWTVSERNRSRPFDNGTYSTL